ncbi:hypothetical protein ACVINW_003672 [Bradyrhizobium sp. USDA 4461]
MFSRLWLAGAVSIARLMNCPQALNSRPMRHVGKSRRELLEVIERAIAATPDESLFEYAEWKTATVHFAYRVNVDKTFYLAPRRLISRPWTSGLPVAQSKSCRITTPPASATFPAQPTCYIERAHPIPSALRRYDAGQLDRDGGAERYCFAMAVEGLMRGRPHSGQYFYFAMGITALARRYECNRLEAACESAFNAISCSSASAVVDAGLDRASPRRATINEGSDRRHTEPPGPGPNSGGPLTSRIDQGQPPYKAGRPRHRRLPTGWHYRARCRGCQPSGRGSNGTLMPLGRCATKRRIVRT